MLIDTHTHLYLEQFDTDRHQVIEAAIKAGVEKMLLPNIDSTSIQAMNELHQSFQLNCPQMMGLHPTSVGDDFETQLEVVEKELGTGRYIGVGEIGMDLYWDTTFIEQQKEALRRQLKLAKNLGLPVSIHTRDAFEEIYEVVKEESSSQLKGVFHCFTGSYEEAQKVINVGFKLGIGGVVTFKNSNLGNVLKQLPIEQMVLETDAPFLSPMPYRGKRNQSSYLVFIAEKLAEIKGVSLEKVAECTTATARETFNLT